MAFEQHAFISYAHVDNLATPDEKNGWVTRFHQQLTAYLSTEIAAEARLWRDDRLRGNEIFGSEIVAQFPKTALLIAVVSPRYLESDWCRREIEEFCAVAERCGGVVVGNSTRIVRVLLKPLEPEQMKLLPQVSRADESLGYPFYEEVEGRRTLRLDPALGNGDSYRRNVMFLAEDLAKLIRQLEQTTPAVAQPSPDVPDLAVYLAECGADLRECRERLRAELKVHQVRVLPDQPMPELQADYVAEVGRLLAQCQLSIHLVGSAYGSVPDGPGLKSKAVLQNECAIERCRVAALPRLIWLPEDVVPEVEPQSRFVAALRSSAELQTGADLLCGSLETFKTAMHAALKKLRQKAEPEPLPNEGSGAPSVHLLCDEKDRKGSVGLRKLLRERGFELSLPVFEGDAASVRETNQRLACASTAVLVYYGAGGEAWKRTVDNDLKKLRGLRPNDRVPLVWTYLAEPDSGDKDDLVDMGEPNLIDGRGGLSEQGLQPLLTALAGVQVCS